MANYARKEVRIAVELIFDYFTIFHWNIDILHKLSLSLIWSPWHVQITSTLSRKSEKM